jgi:hypothetical protein
MGGTGSGRWIYHDKRRTVEKCWMLDISDVTRAVDLRNPGHSGSLRQVKVATRKTVAPVLCANKIGDDGASVVGLSYTVEGRWGLKRQIEESVHLQTTHPNFGGARWWFSCPRVLEGGECARRVGKLYRPPGGRYFACRHCLDLTYESCQRSHVYTRLWKSMSPGEPEVEEMLHRFSSTIAREKRKRALVPSRTLLETFDEAFGQPATKRPLGTISGGSINLPRADTSMSAVKRPSV